MEKRDEKYKNFIFKGSIKISQEDPEPGFWQGTASFETKFAPPFQVRQQPILKRLEVDSVWPFWHYTSSITGTRVVSCPLHPALGGPRGRPAAKPPAQQQTPATLQDPPPAQTELSPISARGTQKPVEKHVWACI